MAQLMLEGGPYRGHFLSVKDPGDELRIKMFESGIAAVYRRRGELMEMSRFTIGTYDFLDLMESADSLNTRPPGGVCAVAGEYDPAFLVLTKEERRRRKHGKRTQSETEEDAGY